MTQQLAFHLTENWRATFVPIGVIIAGGFAFLGVLLTRRHERRLKFEEILWHKRADVFDRFEASYSHALRTISSFQQRVEGTTKQDVTFAINDLFNECSVLRLYSSDPTVSTADLTARLVIGYTHWINGEVVAPDLIGDAEQSHHSWAMRISASHDVLIAQAMMDLRTGRT